MEGRRWSFRGLAHCLLLVVVVGVGDWIGCCDEYVHEIKFFGDALTLDAGTDILGLGRHLDRGSFYSRLGFLLGLSKSLYGILSTTRVMVNFGSIV